MKFLTLKVGKLRPTSVVRGGITSDIFARNVLKDKEVSEYILRIIMDDKNLTVTENITQADFSNLRGRSTILDCLAKSGDGRVFNIEVQ